MSFSFASLVFKTILAQNNTAVCNHRHTIYVIFVVAANVGVACSSSAVVAGCADIRPLLQEFWRMWFEDRQCRSTIARGAVVLLETRMLTSTTHFVLLYRICWSRTTKEAIPSSRLGRWPTWHRLIRRRGGANGTAVTANGEEATAGLAEDTNPRGAKLQSDPKEPAQPQA